MLQGPSIRVLRVQQVTEAHTVVLAGPKGPLVKLDDKYYKLVDKMEALTQVMSHC